MVRPACTLAANRVVITSAVAPIARPVLLSNGRYRMTAMVRHEDIEALAGGDGGLRLMAGEASGAAQLGDAKWTDL